MKVLKKAIAVFLSAVLCLSSLNTMVTAAEKSDKIETYSISYDKISMLTDYKIPYFHRDLIFGFDKNGDSEKLKGFSIIDVDKWRSTGKFNVKEVKADFKLDGYVSAECPNVKNEDMKTYADKDIFFILYRADKSKVTAMYDRSENKIKKLVDKKGTSYITADGHSFVQTSSALDIYYLKKKVESIEFDKGCYWFIQSSGYNLAYGYKVTAYDSDTRKYDIEFFTVKKGKNGKAEYNPLFTSSLAYAGNMYGIGNADIAGYSYKVEAFYSMQHFVYDATKNELIFINGDPVKNWSVAVAKSEKYGNGSGILYLDSITDSLNSGKTVARYTNGLEETSYCYALVNLKTNKYTTIGKEIKNATATYDGNSYSGEIISDFYSYMGEYCNGYYLVETADGKWGFINSKGKLVKTFTDASGFNGDGYALVNKNDKSYLVDQKFNVVSESFSAKSGSTSAIPYVFRYVDNNDKVHFLTYKNTASKPELGKPTLKASKGDNSVKLSWTKVTGAEKYQVYYSVNGGKYKKLTTTSKLTKTVKGLDFSKNTYKFKVRAVAEGSDGKTYAGSYSGVKIIKKG